MSKNNRVLFIYTNLSTFVQTDISIIKQSFQLKSYSYNANKKLWLNAVEQVKLLFWVIGKIYKAKAVYIWFADYHSLIPILFARVFKKPSYLVIGGYDVTSIPEICYGSFSNPIRAFFTRYSIKYASLNLPVVDSLVENIYKYVPSAKVKVICTGYDAKLFSSNNIPKKNIILTVGTADNWQRIKIKGIDTFIKVAEKMPKIKFIMVGVNKVVIKKYFKLPPNVEIIEEIPQKELIKYYQKAKIYAQFSLREGLPNVVCEAMLCKCIPVGFNVGGIPIAIGDCGYILNNKDINEIVKVLNNIILSGNNMGKNARDRIIDNFSLEKRRKEIFEILTNS